MTLYYADAQKHALAPKCGLINYQADKEANQDVQIRGSALGIAIRPGKRWSRFCEELFRTFRADGVWLDSVSHAPDGNLDFVNKLPACTRLAVGGEEKVDLSPLAGNRHLEDLEVYAPALSGEFDLTSLPNLRRCRIPAVPGLIGVIGCKNLVSLALQGGKFDGILKLDTLPALEEFICFGVAKLKGITLHPKARLRSFEVTNSKSFESVEPLAGLVKELLVVTLNKAPAMEIEWLAEAKKAECIALRLGEIPSVKFLSGLKNLQVLDLFGSKVKDGDLSFRDSLIGKLDDRPWGGRGDLK